MASFQAIRTISDVLVGLLRASDDRAEVVDGGLEFDVYRGEDFSGTGTDAVSTGVTFFLYRTSVNGTNRTPPGRRLSNGKVQRSQLPLDLHYLATVWAEEASTQHQIVGWLTRTLATTPILPEGVLNGVEPEVFRPDETVEIILNDLSNEELFRIWDLLGTSYRLSVPYLVRTVRIESSETVPSEGAVERRIFEFLQHGGTSRSGPEEAP